jgi:hypothetical protein
MNQQANVQDKDEALREAVERAERAELEVLRQVEGRNYNPPKRDRLLEGQAQQEFAILPHLDDPSCGHLYRNLRFPDSIYIHISQYQEQSRVQIGIETFFM